MRRLLLLGSLLATCCPIPAFADADRAVIEDSSNGATSDFSLVTATYRVVWDNGSTTLVPQTCAANVCTRAAPSGATEGILLTGIGEYSVEAALSTGTFSGTGTCQTWRRSPNTTAGLQWGYVVGKDKNPASGQTVLVWPTEKNSFAASEYRLAIRCSAVGTSAAAPILEVRIFACKKPGLGCGSAARERPPPAQRWARSWRPPPRPAPVAFVLPGRRIRMRVRGYDVLSGRMASKTVEVLA